MRTLLTVIVAIILAMVVSSNASANLIENGDFEAGLFDPWQVSNPTSESNWVLNDGLVNPPGPGTPLPPLKGMYDAKSLQVNSGSSWISQSFQVPIGTIESVTMSWINRIENHAGFFQDGVQQFWVEILDGTEVVQRLFSTHPGDSLSQQNPTKRYWSSEAEYDPINDDDTDQYHYEYLEDVGLDFLTSLQEFSGQLLTLSFQETHVGYFNIALDDVFLDIKTSPVPEPATLLLLGSGLIGLAGYSRCRLRRK